MFHIQADLSAVRPVEHGDISPGREVADRQRLAEMGHEEMPASRLHQRRHHPRGAQSVSVSLDHACHRAGVPVRQGTPVGGNGAEVDVEDAAWFRRHWRPS